MATGKRGEGLGEENGEAAADDLVRANAGGKPGGVAVAG